jgi:ABC-type transporter Mla maintaining outer membrane lipid asymmetry ATPase subunit MlaF
MTTPKSNREPTVNVALRGAKVTATFRENLFDASNRAGMTPNEFVLQAAAEKLKMSGRQFSGLFFPGDLSGGMSA